MFVATASLLLAFTLTGPTSEAPSQPTAECRTCHEAANAGGVPVESTFTEWSHGPAGRRGVDCLGCHQLPGGAMPQGGPATDEGPASGATRTVTAARAQLPQLRTADGHGRALVNGEVTLSVEPAETQASRGQPLALTVLIDTRQAGHALPTGSPQLRQLWLEVIAVAGGAAERLPARPRRSLAREGGDYEIAGAGPLDGELLGDDVPAGSRIFRTVFVDAEGHPTLRSWEAARILSDTRLQPGTVQAARYSLAVPPDAPEVVIVRAVLRYRAYPSAFAALAGLPPAESVKMAEVILEIPVVASAPAPAAPLLLGMAP